MKPFSYGIIPYLYDDRGVSILLSKTSKNSPTYDFIKGKIEFGETPIQCCNREVFEEIGIPIANCDLENLVIQKNKKKDIGLFFINWDRYKTFEFKLQKEEIYSLEWFNVSNIPEVSKNQRLLITPILERFNKLNFLKG